MSDKPFPQSGDNFKRLHPSVPIVRAAMNTLATLELQPSVHHRTCDGNLYGDLLGVIDRHWPPDLWDFDANVRGVQIPEPPMTAERYKKLTSMTTTGLPFVPSSRGGEQENN